MTPKYSTEDKEQSLLFTAALTHPSQSRHLRASSQADPLPNLSSIPAQATGVGTGER